MMRGFTMVAGMNRLHLSGARMTNDQQLKTIAWFGSLPPVLPTEMVGLWQGEGISSGHPLDGVLENLQWFGKRFHADLRADALLFQWQTGRLIALEPSFLPIKLALRLAAVGRTSIARNWFSYMQKACRARGTTAMVELRKLDGAQTAAMVYDSQPIVDYFKRICDDQIAGMMAVEGDARRYFFRLWRVEPRIISGGDHSKGSPRND